MNKDNPLKHFVCAFLLALVIYAVFYASIERRRARNGPWQVTFTNDPAGSPAVLINQSRLSISNVQISFPGETFSSAKVTITNPALTALKPGDDGPPLNAGVTLIFDQPRQVPYDLPFGKCIFMDTTFLPGTVTFQFFGHEIELLPRVLMIDHEEHPWRPREAISLRRARVLPEASKP
jgi:hypothetical protein